MSKKNETPVAVRVARWTALAAAITALGTIGNTFVDKRPWFLGGEDTKPAIVVQHQVEKHSPDHYESPNIIKFNINQSTDVQQATINSTITSDGRNFEKVRKYKAEEMPNINGTSDVGWWSDIINFIEDRSISFWIISASIVLLGGYSIIEFFYIDKKKKMIMFDSTPPTT